MQNIEIVKYIEIKCVKCGKTEYVEAYKGREDIDRYGDELDAAKAKHDSCFA